MKRSDDANRGEELNHARLDSVDETDQGILRRLNADARATHSEISRSVGLTPSAVRVRIGKLEAAGVIQGYRTEFNPASLGFEVSAIVLVALSSYQPTAVAEFERAVQVDARVVECVALMGEHDYLLSVVARSVQDLGTYLRLSIGSLPWVARFESTLVLSAVKSEYNALTDFPQR